MAASGGDAVPNVGAHVGVVLVFMVFMLGMYALPTIVAAVRKHRQLAPIALLNLVLGWSVIGWIAAMVWSLTNQQPQQTIIVQQAPPQS